MYKLPQFLYFSLFLLLAMQASGSAAVQMRNDTVSRPNVTGIAHHQKHLQTRPPGIRTLNSEALKIYRQQPEFQYNDETKVQEQSWWSRFWRAFWRWLESLFGKEDTETEPTSTAWGTLLVILFVAVVLYLAMKYMHLENIFRKKPESLSIPYNESLKNIHEISFDNQISEAIEKKNYKIAVRLHYLSVLKRLNDAGLIAWQPDKPNSVYLQELEDKKYRETFELLTRQFEYVWYGDFPLGEQAFGNINRLFADFKRTLP
ncbi:MAG: DUF4129 domain-containing protein [Arcticibacter sp.]